MGGELVRTRGVGKKRVTSGKHALRSETGRTKRRTWREFLAAHWDVLAAADFFTIEVWTPRGLTRFTVLILIHLASRRVQIAGISAEPDGPWVTQLMRNATDVEDGFLRNMCLGAQCDQARLVRGER